MGVLFAVLMVLAVVGGVEGRNPVLFGLLFWIVLGAWVGWREWLWRR